MNTVIRKNFFYNFLNIFANLCFPLVTLPYITRVLGPEYYGRVSFAISLSAILLFFGGNGIQIYALREISKVYKNKKLFKKTCTELLLTFLCLSVIATGLYLLIIGCLAKNPEDYLFLSIFSTQIFFNFLSLEWLFKTLNLNDKIAFRNLLIKMLTIISIFVLVKTKHDFIIYSFILNFSFVVAYLMYGLSSVQYFTWEIRKLNLRKHLPVIGFTFLIGLVTLFYKEMDKLIVGYFLGNIPLAFYNVAQRVVVIQSMLLLALPGVLYTFIIDAYHHQQNFFQQLVRNLFNFIIYFSLYTVIVDIVLAKQIILLLFGPEYLAATTTLRVLAVNLPISTIGTILGSHILYSLGGEKKYFWAVFSVFIVCLLGFIILIPRYSFNGAAYALLAAETTGLGILLWRARKYIVNWLTWRQIITLGVIVATTALTAEGLVAEYAHLPLIVLIGLVLVVSAAVYFLLSIVLRYDLAFISYFIFSRFKPRIRGDELVDYEYTVR